MTSSPSNENTFDKAPLERETGEWSVSALQSVLALVADGQVRCSAKTLRPSGATTALIGSTIPGGDFYSHEPIAAFAWPLIVQTGGLTALVGSKLEFTSKGRAAQRKDPEQVLDSLWGAWLRRGSIDEFSRVEAVKGQRGIGVLSGLRPRRAIVAAGLSLCQPGEWTDVDELFRRMRRKRLHPTVFRNERAMWRLYLGDPEYGSFGFDEAHDWALLEGRYVLAVAFEYAATLGLIDVRYVEPEGARDDFGKLWGGEGIPFLSRYDGLTEIRVTARGECCLRSTP